VSKFLKEALEQAKAGSEEDSLIPVVVLGEKYQSDMYAFMDLDHLLKLLEIMKTLLEEPPTILVGEGETE